MSHLEQRLEQDLNEIREKVAGMGTDVQCGLSNAFTALQTADEKLAFSTILSDHPINRTMRKIDKLCHAFIAVHLPSAGHLRLLSTVIRVNIILERIGDYAVTIARESVQLKTLPSGQLRSDLDRISSGVSEVLAESLEAFNQLDAARARHALGLAEAVESNMDSIYDGFLNNPLAGERRDNMICLIIFNQLKRVADQAKNLAEETIFAATGETKAPKIYRILFLDEDNSCLGPMATLIARKVFPEIGEYSCVGVKMADAMDANMAKFMRDRGFDMHEVAPSPLDTRRECLTKYHVIVGLNQSVRAAIQNIPFRTSKLTWNDKTIPESDDPQAWKALYQDLALEIRELMVLLRGEEAL